MTTGGWLGAAVVGLFGLYAMLDPCPWPLGGVATFYKSIADNDTRTFDLYLNGGCKQLPTQPLPSQPFPNFGIEYHGALDYAVGIKNMYMVQRLVLEHNAYLYNRLMASLPDFHHDLGKEMTEFLVHHGRMSPPMVDLKMSNEEIAWAMRLWENRGQGNNFQYSLGLLLSHSTPEKMERFKQLATSTYGFCGLPSTNDYWTIVFYVVMYDHSDALSHILVNVSCTGIDANKTLFFMPRMYPTCQNMPNRSCWPEGGADQTICQTARGLERTKIASLSLCVHHE